jgi:hypothetical protein
VGFYIFCGFWNLGCIVGIYKDIQCRWVKSCSRCVKSYNSTTATPRAILTAARVGRYDHITPIYIPPYAVPPATLIPGSPVSGLTGSQGSRVTGHHGLQGHWIIGSITRVFSIAHISRVTMVSGHGLPWVTITRVSGHHGLRGHPLPSPWVSGLGSLWSRVTGSPWSQGLHGHRVTHHPGSRISHHPGYRVTITMVSGHIQPWSYHGGVLRLDPTNTPSLK